MKKPGTTNAPAAAPDSGQPAFPLQSQAARKYWIQLSDLNWWIVLLIYTLGAVISAGTTYTAGLAEEHPIPYLYPALWEFTGYYAQCAMLPFIVLAFSRLPIHRANWLWTVPTLLLCSMGIGAIHTSLMFLSRNAIYHLLGLGVYNFGPTGYRLLMEYHTQFIQFWAVYVILLFIAHFRERREREREAAILKLKTSELEKQLAQVQLEALRSQLNPHFLFNTLNMVSSVMYESVERADRMIAALSRMLRMSLEEQVGTRVPVRRELEFVQCAAELIRARFQERVEITLSCQPDILDDSIPNLLLYTFIENAIKHHDFEGNPVIRVEARLTGNASAIEMDVLDNGPGIADVAKALRSGVGLSNTRQRLAALYGNACSLELINRPEGGLHVHVSIPGTPARGSEAKAAAAVTGQSPASLPPSGVLPNPAASSA